MTDFEIPKILEKDTYEMSNCSGKPGHECAPGCDATAVGSGWCTQ